MSMALRPSYPYQLILSKTCSFRIACIRYQRSFSLILL